MQGPQDCTNLYHIKYILDDQEYRKHDSRDIKFRKIQKYIGSGTYALEMITNLFSLFSFALHLMKRI